MTWTDLESPKRCGRFMLPKRAKPGWKPQTCLEDQTDTVRIKMLAEIVGLKGASSLPGWKHSSKLRGSEVHKTAGLKNTSVCRAVKGGRLSPDWQAFAGPMESDRLECGQDDREESRPRRKRLERDAREWMIAVAVAWASFATVRRIWGWCDGGDARAGGGNRDARQREPRRDAGT